MWITSQPDHKNYFLHHITNEKMWYVFLSDMVYIWNEAISEEQILKRFERSNPVLKVKIEKMKSIVFRLLTEKREDIVRSFQGNVLKLSQKLSEFEIKINFELEKGSPELFNQEITFPLLLMIKELNHRNNKLCDLLEAKDKEIAEYKLEGGVINRRGTVTEPFKKNSFINNDEVIVEQCEIPVSYLKFFSEENECLFNTIKKAWLQLSIDPKKKDISPEIKNKPLERKGFSLNNKKRKVNENVIASIIGGEGTSGIIRTSHTDEDYDKSYLGKKDGDANICPDADVSPFKKKLKTLIL